MNVLVVCHFGLYKDFSFSFVHAQTREYVRLGHRVRAIVPIPIGKKDWNNRRFSFENQIKIIDGVEIILLRYFSISNYGEKHFNTNRAIDSIKLSKDKIFRDFVPDIIHAHTFGFDSDIGAWLKKRFEIPLVVTTHGSDTSLLVENKEYTRLKEYADKADYIVAVSTALANKLKLCATNTPISVILNGFAIQNMHNNLNSIKHSFSLLQVGHLIEQKKFDITIKAVSKWHEIHSEVTLTIIGQGVKRDELEKMCRELGIFESIRFLGQVPNEVVLQEMAHSQFFVMPSVREGFGIVYLEAMASGCITIGTKGEGIADFIIDGYNGFLVPPNDPNAIVDKLEFCRKNPEQAKRIAKQGKKDAMAMTWEKNAKQYIELFNSLRK